jgi:hypothetical protein
LKVGYVWDRFMRKEDGGEDLEMWFMGMGNY